MQGTSVLFGQVLTVFGIVIAGVWGATQWTAAALGYQLRLGTPWFDFFCTLVYRKRLVWPWHLELIRSSREHRGHDEHGSSGVHRADGDDCSLAAHRRTRRVDCRALCAYAAAALRRQRPGFSQRDSTGGAATPRYGCSTASAVA